MAPTFPRPIEKLMSTGHRRLYRRSRGRRGGTVGTNHRPVLLLTTTGRKSGEPRTWPLIYLQDADRIVVVASNGGRHQHPAWYLNLQTKPECMIQLGAESYMTSARDAFTEEREHLWPQLHKLYGGFAKYMRKTDREFPIIVFESRVPVD